MSYHFAFLGLQSCGSAYTEVMQTVSDVSDVDATQYMMRR